MQYSAEWTEIDAGRRVYLHSWQPAIPPRAIVCIVHGLGEHGGRYLRLASQFAASGMCVFAMDQQGHGQCQRPRGCIESYTALLDDVQRLLRWTKGQGIGLPRVLFGHSMGGNLVLNYALRHYEKPAAVISSSPMIKAANPPHPLLVRSARLLGWVAPNLRLQSIVVAERLMSHPEEQRELESDELFHSQLSLRLAAGLLDSGRWALRHAARLKTPTLLTHGTQDSLTCHQASADFARRAGSICQLEILDGHLHDPFRGLERDEVIAGFLEFIGRQTSQGEVLPLTGHSENAAGRSVQPQAGCIPGVGDTAAERQ